MALTDWMKLYQNRTLGALHMPGSHDAGTGKDHIDLTTMGSVSNAATQSLTIIKQIEAGTRFYDLRLAEHGNRVVAHHTTVGQGAFSRVGVDQVLKDASTLFTCPAPWLNQSQGQLEEPCHRGRWMTFAECAGPLRGRIGVRVERLSVANECRGSCLVVRLKRMYRRVPSTVGPVSDLLGCQST